MKQTIKRHDASIQGGGGVSLQIPQLLFGPKMEEYYHRLPN